MCISGSSGLSVWLASPGSGVLGPLKVVHGLFRLLAWVPDSVLPWSRVYANSALDC